MNESSCREVDVRREPPPVVMSQPEPARRGSRRRLLLAATLAGTAAVMLVASLWLPLWRMRLEAPQYRGAEALQVIVSPHGMGGDLREIEVLNQYIGVHVPKTLPEFRWLPAVLGGGAGLTVLAAALPGRLRRMGLLLVPVGLAMALGAAAIQARGQMRDIGHDRDHKTKLVGVPDFTPPMLGTSRIAQFEVTSRLGAGAILISAAMALQTAAAALSRRQSGFNP